MEIDNVEASDETYEYLVEIINKYADKNGIVQLELSLNPKTGKLLFEVFVEE